MSEKMPPLKRRFSKELASELRQKTATEIKAARNLPSNFKEAKDRSAEINYEDSREILEEMKKNVLGRIFKTRAWLEKEELLKGYLGSEKSWRLESAQRDFEEKLREILTNSPLTPDEQEKYLSEEAMINMELEDYLVLLKRLSGNYLTHVTRFGIRENTFAYHARGQGEFFNSFIDILKNGKLNSFKASFAEGKTSFQIKEVREAVKEHKDLDREEIIKKIRQKLFGGASYILETESVHMALNTAATYNYGSEKDYDFYFYYPAEMIAYNYYHKTRWGAVDKPLQYYNSQQVNDQYNDYEVYNEGRGVPVSAGITCISGDVPVDPETGSQYKLVNGQPQADAEGKLIKADKTITSKEYWEKYFISHPEEKPNKIIWSNFGTYPSWEKGKGYTDLLGKQDLFKSGKYATPETEKYQGELNAKLYSFIGEIVDEELAKIQETELVEN